MSVKLKLHIGNKVFESLKNKSAMSPEIFKSFIQIGVENEENVNMSISLDMLQKRLGIPNTNDILSIKPDGIIKKTYIGNDRANRKVIFAIHRDIFIKDVLENIHEPDLFLNKQKIVIEYSSPNIAKPFHVGHLRSTIIGNFLSNINKFLGHDVVRLNYLGDWGTQFGLLKVGVDLANLTDEQIKTDPLKHLYNAYVNANQLAKTDSKISEKAREVFMRMEQGDSNDLETMKQFRQYTIDELTSLYRRLGVVFDEYNYESMYNARDIANVVNILQKYKIVHLGQDGRKFALIRDKKIPLVKSDGSMLYLTRDIAAALDRYKKHKFDQMLYVVDNSQSEHFNALHDVLFRMDLPWAGRIKHVKFGRILGMSTRKGNAIFLKDILNEAKELMRQNQIKSPTTKVAITDEKVSDVLGISCVIINDLKQRRQKDYQFDWNKVLQEKGDSGVRLQYTHCRLSSLQKNVLTNPAPYCLPELLTQVEVLDLVIHLAKFNDVLKSCYEKMEASGLVVYLFQLCNLIGKALVQLKVKEQSMDLASQRMMLFNVSRNVLKQGMLILGMEPLTEM